MAIGANEKVYMPPKREIWQRYLRKFTKQGKLLETDLGLMEEAPTEAPTVQPEPAQEA